MNNQINIACHRLDDEGVNIRNDIHIDFITKLRLVYLTSPLEYPITSYPMANFGTSLDPVGLKLVTSSLNTYRTVLSCRFSFGDLRW